ncbi:maltoporin [Sorangium cellulosum]|uniref:Maltoporin n=1 Tax=Sorangium cellulosum TaxID=56 RepID=A0A2L0F7B6_SORCE|nr:carbohydrate porin [Sorangium cellulosum]AUX47432.1 maltoporin [Sorangium cellulosum]
MTSLKRDRSSVPSKRLAGRRAAVRALGLVSVSALCLTAAPKSAHAVGSENFEWHWYSRLGMAWSPYGQSAQGASTNLLGFGIGGRHEEGDYSEPSFVAHVVKGATPQDLYVKSEMTFAIWPTHGSFMQPSSNGGDTIEVEFNQAYIESGNFLVPGLSVWGGARFFREQYAPIGDYFYLDDLSGQGGGIKYENLNLAIIGRTCCRTGTSAPGYVFPAEPATPELGEGGIRRDRTIFAGNYKFEFGGEAKHHVKVHAEAHVLQAAQQGPDMEERAPGDFGGVIGAKLHLGLGQGNWSDTSVRFGTGIANGAAGGAKTYETWGAPNSDGTYAGSMALEAVEHVGFRIGDIAALEGLATFHYTKAAYEAEGAAPPTNLESQLDFSVQANAMIFAHKNFHPVVEASFQGRKDGENEMGTAVKVSVVPTLVPTGELSAGARPHFKLIYTAAFYNDAAVLQNMTPYNNGGGYIARMGLRRTNADGTFGVRSNVGHYIGARTDWYF